MAFSPQPCSQMSSVKLGAPKAWLPLPSAPWHAAQAVNLGWPNAAFKESWGLLDKLKTYCAKLRTSSGLPTAAAMGGIKPFLPFSKDSWIFSCEPPCNQSLSVRLGKPLLPRASEPWHWAQLFMNKRSPMAMAWGSLATSSGGMPANLAYKGSNSLLALATSASYWPVDVQANWPALVPKPGYKAK